MKNIKELKAEIKEMEKLAESFVDNKFVRISRKVYGIDAISDLTNFVLGYDKKEAKLQTLKDVLKEIATFKDKVLNPNTTSKNFIEIPDFVYQLKELKQKLTGFNEEKKG